MKKRDKQIAFWTILGVLGLIAFGIFIMFVLGGIG